MWTLDDAAPLPLWRLDAEEPAVVMAFSTRCGGISAPPYDTLNLGRSTADPATVVGENRRRVLLALGLDPERLATAGQIHGNRVARCASPAHVPGCDALVTQVPGLALAVTTADCMSLIYSAPGAVAVAHAGWRGTADGMPVAALHAVCEIAGVQADRVTVHLGPCIRGCCYEVGDEVARRFPPAALRRCGARPRLDLPSAARLQLVAAGLPQENLADVGACTACEPERYFSHRRDRGVTGRHWAVAALRS